MYQPIRASSSPRSSGRRRRAEVQEHRGHRPELDDGGERGARVLPAEERGDDPQVSGARDGEELGEALDDAQDDRLDGAHAVRMGGVTESATLAASMSRG
jgi:hypothetical protein